MIHRFLTLEAGAPVLAPVVLTGEVIFSVSSGKLGYLPCNGQTIGNVGSGATARANSDTRTLFDLLWDIPSLGIFTSSGSSATRTTKDGDWAANCRLALPNITTVSPLNALIKFADLVPNLDLTYTISQNHVWGGHAGTYQNLRDGLGTTGAAAGTISSEWVEADFGQVVSGISGVTVGGGSLAGWGGVALYLNGGNIAVSSNRVDWTQVSSISGVTDSGPTQFVRFNFSPVSARYVRIRRGAYLSTTEFIIHF